MMLYGNKICCEDTYPSASPLKETEIVVQLLQNQKLLFKILLTIESGCDVSRKEQ